MTRNLRLIGLHSALAGALFWIPIMVLLTRREFGVDQAFELSATYYLFVVGLEVPSGWFSDRFGRVPTLRIAAVAWIVAHLCFALGGDAYWMYIVGNAFLAGGFSFLSGTDVSFHFDSLDASGDAEEFGGRESRNRSYAYAAGTVAAIAGGALGLVDLRLPFVLSTIAAVLQFFVTLQFNEPPRSDKSTPGGLVSHIGDVAADVRRPLVGWLFFYGVGMVTLEHVAFTPLQPWLTEALGAQADKLDSTPLVSGLVVAGVALIGALSARSANALWQRFGLAPTLLGLALLSTIIITAMSLTTSLLVIGLIAFRSVQGAAAPVLLAGAIAPRTPQSHRATLLSLNSLVGRLGYSLVLFVVARDIADNVQPALNGLAIIAWIVTALLVISAVAAPNVSMRN